MLEARPEEQSVGNSGSAGGVMRFAFDGAETSHCVGPDDHDDTEEAESDAKGGAPSMAPDHEADHSTFGPSRLPRPR